MPEVMGFVSFDHKYEGIAKFPAVTRDISMLVPSEVLAGQIETIFAQRGGKILEDIKLFDIYEGEQVAKGFKSVHTHLPSVPRTEPSRTTMSTAQ